uniref:Protein FAM136A n=1 Tax=Lygus hesperus TaxID=30085 RepID=A0A0K8TK07_LYGHE
MAEAQARKAEDAMKKLINEVDLQYLRKIQANMHRCAARCCDSTTDSMEQVHNCVQKCSVTLKEAEAIVQNEFNSTQERFQRCVMDCNDTVRDRIGTSPTESEMVKHQNDFESCASKCVDKHVALLPTMMKRMKELLASKQQSSALYYPS